MSKTIIVRGRTNAVIALNKIGVPIRGTSQAVLKIENEEHQKEINGLVAARLIDIIVDDIRAVPIPIPQPNVQQINFESTIDKDQKVEEKNEEKKEEKKATKKNKGGRPKKNKPLSENERVRQAEERTQKLEGRVVIGTGNGNVESKMKRSAINDIIETDKIKASLEAMKQIEDDEKEETEPADDLVNFLENKNLDASEQTGGKATISTESGEKQESMVNNITPGSDEIKKADPFVDKKDKETGKKTDTDDDFGEAFVEI